MQKGTRKTAETREMLRNTILEIKEKFRCNLHHELLSLRVNGKHIQGCIEQNPKKVLMPIYLPPGFYIVYHDVTVPNWMTCPAMEKLEKNMYWKASGISKCDDYSEVIPFSLASLQLRGYIFSLKCDDAIGILEIYPRKQPNSTPRSKTVKKDQPDKLELKMKKALTLSNNDNILQQQSTPTTSKQLSKQQQQQSSINTKHQPFQEQEQQLPIQLIKVENENDIDLCSLTSCTKRQREHANDPALVSFLEPQRSERKRVKIAKVMKENQSIIAAAPAPVPVPVTSAATFSFSSSSSAAANTAVAACFDGNPSTLSSSSCCLTNVARPPEEYDLSSFLSDIDTLETSNIPNIFEGIN